MGSPRTCRCRSPRRGSRAAAEEAYAEQVSDAVASDPDTAAYVEELERRADTLEDWNHEDELPSGDSIAAELTRFLREREKNGDDEPSA